MIRYMVWGILACAVGIAGANGLQPEYSIAQEKCQPPKPRFPPTYQHFASLRAAPIAEKLHTLGLAVKDKETNLQVEATVQEIDLNGDGICDAIVTVRDPVDSGGDSDVLTTLYIASAGQWQRIGSRTAAKTDKPSNVDLIKVPSDENFEFSDYAVLHKRGVRGPANTYLVAWRSERISNGFDGYRVYEIDAGTGMLRLMDKWNGPGFDVYAAFKNLKGTEGEVLFEANTEANELQTICKSANEPNRNLLAACKEFKH